MGAPINANLNSISEVGKGSVLDFGPAPSLTGDIFLADDTSVDCKIM